MIYNDSPVLAENLAQFLWDHRADDIIATVPMRMRYVGTGSSIPDYEVQIFRVVWMRRIIPADMSPETFEKLKELTDFMFSGKVSPNYAREAVGFPPLDPKTPDNWQRFPDGKLKPFLDPYQYDELRDDDRFLYNRGPKPEGLT